MLKRTTLFGIAVIFVAARLCLGCQSDNRSGDRGDTLRFKMIPTVSRLSSSEEDVAKVVKKINGVKKVYWRKSDEVFGGPGSDHKSWKIAIFSVEVENKGIAAQVEKIALEHGYRLVTVVEPETKGDTKKAEPPVSRTAKGVLKHFPSNVRSDRAFYGHTFMIGNTPVIPTEHVTKEKLLSLVGKEVVGKGVWHPGEKYASNPHEQMPVEATKGTIIRGDGIKLASITLSGNGGKTVDRRGDITRCNIHNAELKEEKVEIERPQIHVTWTLEFQKAMNTQFPHWGMVPHIQDEDAESVIIRFCPKCREIRNRWQKK